MYVCIHWLKYYKWNDDNDSLANDELIFQIP